MSTDLNPGIKRTAEPARPAVVKLQYGQIGMMQLRIGTTDTGALLDELTGRIATAPKFFKRTPVCLDLSELEQLPQIDEVKAVIDAVRRAGMLSIGLTGGSTDVERLSTALNLPILSAFRAANNPFPATTQPVPPAQPVAPAATVTATTTADTIAAEAATAAAEAGGAMAALIHSQTVRSGQRIYARDRDLVITAGVGAGAEVMADGCVHIYGSLRGRAMAGVHGQLSARVFCHEFNAELVSIAGVFRVFETIPAELIGQPVQAWLDGEDLRFAVVGN